MKIEVHGTVDEIEKFQDGCSNCVVNATFGAVKCPKQPPICDLCTALYDYVEFVYEKKGEET